MAISMGVPAVLPSIHGLPVYSKNLLSNSKQVMIMKKQYYPTTAVVAPTRTRSDKMMSSLVPRSQPKASQMVFEIVRSISEKDDAEIDADISRIQDACQDLCQLFKDFLRDFLLVLMATNPIVQLFADYTMSQKVFVSQSSLGALYGALIVSRECAKVLWKSKPNWAFIAVGFLIYKANTCNIALYRNGRYPVWAGMPLAFLAFGKFVADCLLLLTSSNIILDLFGIMASLFMSLNFSANNDRNKVKRICKLK